MGRPHPPKALVGNRPLVRHRCRTLPAKWRVVLGGANRPRPLLLRVGRPASVGVEIVGRRSQGGEQSPPTLPRTPANENRLMKVLLVAVMAYMVLTLIQAIREIWNAGQPARQFTDRQIESLLF